MSDDEAGLLAPVIGDVTGQPVRTLYTYVPDGLYESGWQAERPDFLPADDGYLLYVGQLSRHKGVDVLLDAYRRLPSRRRWSCWAHRIPPVRRLNHSPRA